MTRRPTTCNTTRVSSSPSRAGSRRLGERGYTLSELMVILGIMGILATIAVPNFLSIGRRDSVETAAYDLQRTISLARQKALAQRTPYRVRLDPVGHTCVVERRQAGAWQPDGSDTLTWRDDIALQMTAGGSAANTDIEIEPMGTVLDTDAPALFKFSNAHGDTTTVSFVRTGRIRVRS